MGPFKGIYKGSFKEIYRALKGFRVSGFKF